MFEKITKLALFSRMVVLLLQLVFNTVFDNHKPDVFRKPLIENNTHWANDIVTFVFGGLKNWDGEYYLHIAEHGYTYENTLAFYPGYPLCVRMLGKLFYTLGLGLTLHNWMLLVAVGLNLVFFCLATNKLYELTHYLFDDIYKSWHSVLVFCFNPASIFFTAAYSEPLYCFLTFSLMLECAKEQRTFRTIFLLSLSILSRSNGLTNLGFPIYFTFYQCLYKANQAFWKFLKLACIIILSIIPLTVFNFYAYQQYCSPIHPINHHPMLVSYAQERGYILAGKPSLNETSPWCNYSFPFPYSYIQSHYWNVGFLRYYEWKQIPNFILAFPILWFLSLNNFKYFKSILPKIFKKPFPLFLKENKMLPFVIHCLVLSAFCTFFAHIQISTRLLCSATPCFYWYASTYLPKTLEQVKMKSMASFLFLWCDLYYIVGTIMFANSYPWT